MTESFERELDRWRAENEVPAVSAAVRADGSLIWQGVSRAEGVVLPGSRFPIYSITKTFTAVCLLRLDRAGVLSIDDPITKWMPDLSVPASVTLHRLANHTAGIPDYGPLLEYHKAVRTTPSTPWTDERFLAETLGNGLLFQPGTGWSYSNVGYLLLRRTIEKACGVSFRRAVADHIAVPLGLADTFVAETVDDWAGWFRPSSYHPDWCAPGVAVSTPDEITRFYDELFAGALVDSPRLQRMLTLIRVPGEHPPAVTPSYGIGIMGDPDGSFGPSYGHGGRGPGYATSATIWPHSPRGRLSVAVFCKSESEADPGPAVDALFQVASGRIRT